MFHHVLLFSVLPYQPCWFLERKFIASALCVPCTAFPRIIDKQVHEASLCCIQKIDARTFSKTKHFINLHSHFHFFAAQVCHSPLPHLHLTNFSPASPPSFAPAFSPPGPFTTHLLFQSAHHFHLTASLRPPHPTMPPCKKWEAAAELDLCMAVILTGGSTTSYKWPEIHTIMCQLGHTFTKDAISYVFYSPAFLPRNPGAKRKIPPFKPTLYKVYSSELQIAPWLRRGQII